MNPVLVVGSPMVQAVVLAVIGVGFWIGGLVVANYVWKRYRGED